MNLTPYNIFQNISNDTIILRQIQTSDIKDLVEISFYDSVQAKTVQQANEMQAKIWGIFDKVTNLTLILLYRCSPDSRKLQPELGKDGGNSYHLNKS